MKEIDKIVVFPYGNSIYSTKHKLNNEYRKIKVKKYLIFYTINEENKIITIMRILHEKLDINNILN